MFISGYANTENVFYCLNINELVDRAAFMDSVGILRTDLKDKAFARLCDSLV